MNNSQTKNGNFKKRIFISANRYELPFVRRIQTILENDYDYKTYINELSKFENSIEFAKHGDVSIVLEQSKQEMFTHTEILFVTTSQWRRIMMRENIKRMNSNGFNPFDQIPKKYYLDIDDCWLYSGNDLQEYLKKSLSLAINGQRSPYWETPSLTLDQIPTRELIVFKYAQMLLKDFSETHSLEALKKTHGEVVGVLQFLESFGLDTFSNNRPSSMSIGESIAGKLVEVFVWRNKFGRITYNQSYKRKAFNEILLRDFHMYYPHIPRGGVFISHSTKNLATVRHLQLVAEEFGFRTFAYRLGMFEDTNLSTINDLDQVVEVLENIEKEIKECDFVLLADSPEAQITPWTFAEQVMANKHNKRVYRIDIRKFGLQDFFTRDTELRKWFNSFKPNPEFTEEEEEEIDDQINDLKYIMLAQQWLDNLPHKTDTQIADMIRSVSPHELERSSAYLVFSGLCNSRLRQVPDIQTRVVRINHSVFRELWGLD